jgi:Fur family zinc uptake transcriptional regulator
MSSTRDTPSRRLKPANDATPRDHSHCAHDPARAHQGHGLSLTVSRQRILDELCAAGRPVGAYEMIDILADGTGKRPAPISVYRALDFLVDNGLVHRLASRNAFLACAHGHGEREPVVFLICDACGAVAEATSASVNRGLASAAGDVGFSPRAQVIEVAGLCAKCKAA